MSTIPQCNSEELQIVCGKCFSGILCLSGYVKVSTYCFEHSIALLE